MSDAEKLDLAKKAAEGDVLAYERLGALVRRERAVVQPRFGALFYRPENCRDMKCPCHEDEAKAVRTPFPWDVGNPYCCSACALIPQVTRQDLVDSVRRQSPSFLVPISSTSSYRIVRPAIGTTDHTCPWGWCERCQAWRGS